MSMFCFIFSLQRTVGDARKWLRSRDFAPSQCSLKENGDTTVPTMVAPERPNRFAYTSYFIFRLQINSPKVRNMQWQLFTSIFFDTKRSRWTEMIRRRARLTWCDSRRCLRRHRRGFRSPRQSRPKRRRQGICTGPHFLRRERALVQSPGRFSDAGYRPNGPKRGPYQGLA